MLTAQLFEVHYSDLYPRSFSEFYEKYAPLVDDPTLYVNFTDIVGDTVNKTFSPRPNHGDPTGLYAYPLDYVLKHPSEIEYGQQARFLRVIRDTSHHKLNLSTMTWEEAIGLLARMGIAEPEKKMQFVQRRFRYFGGNLHAKQFFGVLQMYRELGQKELTPNTIQNALLRKAGIDAIEDKSSNSVDAIIFHAEPEQCVFLSRSAFQVIDVYELRSEHSRQIYRSDPRELLRRLPGLIAQAIGDRIVANNMKADRSERMTFYTAAKRKIVVMMDMQYRFQVGHREGNVFSGDKITVAIMGPDFQPITHTYPVEESFEQIAADMAQRFAQRTPGQGESYDLITEYGPEVQAVNDTLAKVAAALKVPFTPATDTPTAFRIFATVNAITKSPSFFRYESDRDKLLARWKQVIDQFWPKPRRPQGQQILQIWAKAAANRRKFNTADLHNLDYMARKLGIVGWSGTKKEGESYAKTYGDLTIFRRGDALMIRLGDHEERIAQIDNLKLEDWKKPHGNDSYNHRLMLPYAKDLADYLNTYRFIVDGYQLFLSQFYGISFVNGHWYPMEEVSEKLDTFGPVTIWKFPDEKHGFFDVVATMDGETDNSDLGDLPPIRWRTHLDLFTLNGDNQITRLGVGIKRYLEGEQHRKKNPGHYWGPNAVDDWHLDSGMHSERSAGNKTWIAMQAAGFDIYDYIKQKGYGFAPSMEDELGLFGLKLNQDNGKIGKTFEEILNPVGTFNGLEVYSVVIRQNQWTYPTRHYVFLHDGKIKQAARCERDYHDGKHNTKVLWIADALTPDERKAIAELLASQSLSVPVKFRKNLSSPKPRQSP